MDAIAYELVSAIGTYEQSSERLVETWLDMELYQSVSLQVDHMRLLCASMPQVSVPWVALLISHSHLVFCLWRCGEKFSPSAEFDACRAKHTSAIRALRERCLWLFGRMEE